MKLIKKIIAMVLCVVMAVSVASCGADTSWVVKTEDSTVSSGLYMYYLLGAYSNAYYMVENNTIDILKQAIEGKTAEDWIKDNALENAKLGIVAAKLFEEAGLELSADDKEYAEQYATYYWAYTGDVYTKNGISYETLVNAICTDRIVSILFEHVYGKGGEKEIPAEDVKKGLAENYAKVREIGISLAGFSGEMRSDKLQDTLKAKAEDYKKRIEAGENIEDLIKEHYELEIELAKEEGYTPSESLSGSNEVDTSFVVVDKNSANYSENELTEIFKLETDGVAVVVEKEYIRVFQKYDILEDDTYLEQYDVSVRIALKGEEFTEYLEGLTEELTVELNEDALKKYKPSKIRF